MEVIYTTESDKTIPWKIIDVHCFSYRHDTCTRFPICQSYCTDYTEKPTTKAAIAYFNGTCHTRHVRGR